MSQIPNANMSNPSSEEPAVELAIEFLKFEEVWMNTDESIMFRATLPGTNLEDLKIQTVEDGKFLKLTKVLPAGSEDGDEAVKWFLKEWFTDGEISRDFSLPEGVKNTNEFKTEMNPDGELTVTFTKLKPQKKLKKLKSKVGGFLKNAGPGLAAVGAKYACDSICDDN